MTDKEKLMKLIEELPDNIQFYKTHTDKDDCIDIKVFVKPKSVQFLQEYFGP